jgi:hypothetical protein
MAWVRAGGLASKLHHRDTVTQRLHRDSDKMARPPRSECASYLKLVPRPVQSDSPIARSDVTSIPSLSRRLLGGLPPGVCFESHIFYRLNSRVISSIPFTVSGNIRPSIRSLSIEIDRTCPQLCFGVGFNHAERR